MKNIHEWQNSFLFVDKPHMPLWKHCGHFFLFSLLMKRPSQIHSTITSTIGKVQKTDRMCVHLFMYYFRAVYICCLCVPFICMWGPFQLMWQFKCPHLRALTNKMFVCTGEQFRGGGAGRVQRLPCRLGSGLISANRPCERWAESAKACQAVHSCLHTRPQTPRTDTPRPLINNAYTRQTAILLPASMCVRHGSLDSK